jgi:hypothetical protein
MTSSFLKCGALLAALIAPVATCSAANGIGSFTGTSNPEVIVPPLIGPPQTPSYLVPPIYAPDPAFVVTPSRKNAPRALAPVKPRW